MQISPQVTGWKQSTRSLKFRLLLRLEEISGAVTLICSKMSPLWTFLFVLSAASGECLWIRHGHVGKLHLSP